MLINIYLSEVKDFIKMFSMITFIIEKTLQTTMSLFTDDNAFKNI